MRNSRWREPRWNADRRAPFAKGAPHPQVRSGVRACRRSASFFISSLRAKRSKPVGRFGKLKSAKGSAPLLDRFVATAPRNDALFDIKLAKLGCGCVERTRSLIRPRDSGGGGPRVCAVEGASDSEPSFRRRRIIEARAPPTALRAVRPPRYHGAGEGARKNLSMSGNKSARSPVSSVQAANWLKQEIGNELFRSRRRR